jgi:hypothetical protein
MGRGKPKAIKRNSGALRMIDDAPDNSHLHRLPAHVRPVSDIRAESPACCSCSCAKTPEQNWNAPNLNRCGQLGESVVCCVRNSGGPLLGNREVAAGHHHHGARVAARVLGFLRSDAGRSASPPARNGPLPFQAG